MQIGVAKAKDSFSELIERAEQGEVVTITRHGRPVATINPARSKPTRAELDKLFREIEEDRKKLPPITREQIVSAIKADRRF